MRNLPIKELLIPNHANCFDLSIPLTNRWCKVELVFQMISGFFRTMWYLPSVIPVVAVAWTWRTLLNDNYGLIN